MTVSISRATGNATAATTWGVGSVNSYLYSRVNTTTVPTVATASATFQPGAVTVDGIAIYLATIVSVNGTFTAELFNSTGSATVNSVTINVSSLAPTVGAPGWVFLKFASTNLLLAATNYTIRLSTSVASTVQVFTDATANNWSRCLRTTTTTAASGAMDLIACGERVAAGTLTSFAITWDLVGTVSNIFMCEGAPVTQATTASTNYNFGVGSNADWRITANGSYLCSGLPTTSTIDCSSAGFAVTVDGSLQIFAPPKVTSAKLVGDLAVGATSAVLDTDTGWLSTYGSTFFVDQFLIGSGGSDNNNSAIGSTDFKNVATAVANNLTWSGGTSFTHKGTSPTQSDVVLVTRFVMFRGTGHYFIFNPSGIVVLDHCMFRSLGSNTAGQRGLEIKTDSAMGGYLLITNCTFAAQASGSTVLSFTQAVTNNFFINYNTFGNMSTGGAFAAGTTQGGAIDFSATCNCSGSTINNNIFMGCINNFGNIISFNDSPVTFNNNTISTLNTDAIVFKSTCMPTGNFDNNTIHNVVGKGISVASTASIYNLTISGLTSYNNTSAVALSGMYNCTISNHTCLGLESSISAIGRHFSNTILNPLYNHTTGIGAATGINFSIALVLGWKLAVRSPTVGAATSLLSAAGDGVDVAVFNATFSGSSAFANALTGSGIIRSINHGATGTHISYVVGGSSQSDATIWHNGDLSERLTPNSATVKLSTGPSESACLSGTTALKSVWVRKSSVNDVSGAAYNGNQPRLILKANPTAGIAADVVLATMVTGSTALWEQLSGITTAPTKDCVLTFVVDCDGTAGWINVDDWKVV